MYRRSEGGPPEKQWKEGARASSDQVRHGALRFRQELHVAACPPGLSIGLEAQIFTGRQKIEQALQMGRARIERRAYVGGI